MLSAGQACLSHPPLKDYIGKKFGKLTVVEYAGMLLFIALNRTYLLGLAALAGLIEYGYQNNQIMIYVEHKLYD